MTPPQIVGARIRELRLASGKSAATIAEVAGIKRPNLHRLERGVSQRGVSWPRLDTLARVATALGTTVADLVRDV